MELLCGFLVPFADMKAAVLALTNISLMRFTFGALLQDEIVGRYFEGDAEAAAANFIGGGMALMTELGDLLSSLPPSMINGTALVESLELQDPGVGNCTAIVAHAWLAMVAMGAAYLGYLGSRVRKV